MWSITAGWAREPEYRHPQGSPMTWRPGSRPAEREASGAAATAASSPCSRAGDCVHDREPCYGQRAPNGQRSEWEQHVRHRVPSRRRSASSSPIPLSPDSRQLEQEDWRQSYRKLGEKSPERFWAKMAKENVSLVHALEEGARLEAAASPSGSSAPRPTSATTASIGTWRARTPGGATRRRSSGKASPATTRVITYAELHREVCSSPTC